MNAKRIAAEKAVELIREGMVVGLGTGSTSFYAIQAIAEKVKYGLNVKAVASSLTSEQLARELGIEIIPFSPQTQIDLYIDGADEVDSNRNLIKGGGGALLREKILAYNSRQFAVIIDQSKLVEQLGKFPLPVEIINFASPFTITQIANLGCSVVIRNQDGKNFISDNGNLVVDCDFKSITDVKKLNSQINEIPGVVDCGLFLSEKVSQVIVGYVDGSVRMFD